MAEAGEGPPLLLLHGWPQHWWCWRRLIPPLAESHRVLAPDLRGFGWSDAPPGDYSKASLTADILALLDAEGLDRVRILSHDWGAYSGFLLALDHPERVEQLVALDIGLPWWRRERPSLRQLGAPLLLSYQLLLAAPVIGPAAISGGTGFVRSFLSGGSGPAMNWSDDEVDAYARVLQAPERARASSALYRTFLTRELPALAAKGDRSHELEVPSLLVMGGASPLRMLEPTPGPSLGVTTVPGAGHFLPEEAPDEVLALTRKHFRVPRGGW